MQVRCNGEGGPHLPPGGSAGTGGIGTQADQHGSSAEGGAAYSLGGDENPTDQASPSGA